VREIIDSLPGHEGFVAVRLASGGVARAEGYAGPFHDYVAACDCGWFDERAFPAGETGRQAVAEQWWRAHAIPLLTTEPPGWLTVKSDVLREQIEILLGTQPQAALKLLAEVDGWRRTLTEQAVAEARKQGMSWASIGSTLGISRQAAHERYST
jgi:hypothetical protein